MALVSIVKEQIKLLNIKRIKCHQCKSAIGEQPISAVQGELNQLENVYDTIHRKCNQEITVTVTYQANNDISFTLLK